MHIHGGAVRVYLFPVRVTVESGWAQQPITSHSTSILLIFPFFNFYADPRESSA